MRNKVKSVTFILDTAGQTKVEIRRSKGISISGSSRVYIPTNDQIHVIKQYMLMYGIVRPESTVTENSILLYYALWSIVRK